MTTAGEGAAQRLARGISLLCLALACLLGAGYASMRMSAISAHQPLALNNSTGGPEAADDDTVSNVGEAQLPPEPSTQPVAAVHRARSQHTLPAVPTYSGMVPIATSLSAVFSSTKSSGNSNSSGGGGKNRDDAATTPQLLNWTPTIAAKPTRPARSPVAPAAQPGHPLRRPASSLTTPQGEAPPLPAAAYSPPFDAGASWLQGPEYDDNKRIVSLVERTVQLRTQERHDDSCPASAGRGPTAIEGFVLTPPPLPRGVSCYRLGHPVAIRVATNDQKRRKHCLGGDFFETEFTSHRLSMRPKTIDHGDGSYTIRVLVPDDALFVGRYRLRVTLLFTRYGGLTTWGGWRRDLFWKKPRSLELSFGRAGDASCGAPPPVLDELPSSADTAAAVARPLTLGDSECGGSYRFGVEEWAGMWIRVGDPPLESCRRPYCVGDVPRSLGSQAEGWVYRLPHCYFRLYTRQEAKSCLGGKWMHMIGDSNHQDSARNLCSDVLGAPVVKNGGLMPRNFDLTARWSDGTAGRRWFRVSNQFNGAPETLGNNVGMRSYDVPEVRRKHLGPFRGAKRGEGPAVVVFNSGLHDALYMPEKKWSPARFDRVADAAMGFFLTLLNASSPRPIAIWHSTVTPAGVKNRRMPLNPQKVEVQNRLTLNLLPEGFLYVDTYDMTFPWHWGNKYSDGGHYGRPPWHRNAGGRVVGSTKFVDVMYTHVLLSALHCKGGVG